MAGRLREDERTRALLVQACARIMAEEGVRDYLVAKRKAAQRLGISSRALMPSNVEIDAAVHEYQRLFLAGTRPEVLNRLRSGALGAMRFFEQFRPRLVGAVLSGTASPDTDVQLHLFADAPEEVQFYLMRHEIPFETGARRLRVGAGGYESFPTFAFGAGDVNVDLTIFPPESEREAPRSPVDGRPMKRATLRDLALLIADE